MPPFGAPNIDDLKAKRDVDGLIEALRHKDEHVRRQAAEALGELKDRRAVEPLIAALKDEDTAVRLATADALGAVASPSRSRGRTGPE